MHGASDSRLPGRSPPRFWQQGKLDTSVAEFVSISAPVGDLDTITRNGDLLRVWRLNGVTFEGVQPQTVSARHEALCNLLTNLPEGRCAVYMHRIQRRATDRLTEPNGPTFSRDFSTRYQDAISHAPFLMKDFFITLLYRPFDTEQQKTILRNTRTADDLARLTVEHLGRTRELAALVESALQDFEPTALGVREDCGVRFWESGELFSCLINGEWKPVRMPDGAQMGPAWRTLPDSRLTFGGAQLEIRNHGRRRFATLMDIKEFSGEVEPGTLSPLLYIDSEYIETQCLALMSRRSAMAALKLQRDQLIASDDVVHTQIVAMDEAMNDLGDGRFAMGEYSYSLAVFGDTATESSERARSAAASVARLSALQLVPVDLVADAAWFSQLPGNFQWRTRKASISSRAFAALACCHTFLLGKRDGNPWGEALAVMRTPAGHPFYLNLHVSRAEDDATGKKLPGNTILIGQTGSGKTTLLTSLMALTPKWRQRPRIVSFSLDRDTEIVIRALGGSFYRFEHGRPTGINPLQREPTEARMGHWSALVRQCLATPQLPLLPSELDAIDKAVRGVAAMGVRDRWFSTVKQQLPRNGENSLFNRMNRWCRGNEMGWVFDEANDQLLDVKTHHAIGFDYTGILDSEAARVPVMMELLNIMDDLIDGTPLIYHVAEAWKALGDPMFAGFVKHRQKTIRKMNGLGIFDTQQVDDLLNNANGRVMIEQSVTKIILPNSDADRDEYVGGLGLTDSEFELVQRLGRDGSRRFLIKQGGVSNQCGFDLGGMDDMLTVLSTTLDNVELLDHIRAEVGDVPEAWLPVLYRRAQERTSLLRRAA